MVSQAQRDWAAAGRAAAAADPKKYESVRIESSVDRARKKTEKATEAVAATGRKYRGPTPAQVAAGTLEVETSTTKHREETRRVAIAKDLPTIHAKEPTDVRVTDEYRGPTPAQIAAGTLEVEPPTTVHRVKARAAALLKPEIKTGEIPQELVALRTREKTLELMEEALSPDVHPIVKGEYEGTKADWEKYQRQFGEYETEYKDYSKEYEQVKGIYETRQKAAEELKRDEITPTIPEGIHAVQPTILIHGKTPADYGKDIQVYRDPSLKEIEAAISKKIPKFESLVSRSVEVVEEYPKISETLISAREIMYATPRRELSSEIISAFGEGVYTHVQEKPVETAAYVAAGYVAAPLIGAVAPAVKILPYGAHAVRAASTIGKIPYLGYAARKAPGAAMFSLFGATEYQKVTQPVFTGEYTEDEEGFPIMRKPTYPEMAGRLGETVVIGEAMLVGAGLYKYGDIGISKIKSLPKEDFISRIPSVISEVRPSLRAMMVEEKAVASLIPRKVRLARQKEFKKYVGWEKETGKLPKERIFEIREELAFKHKYYKELKYKIRTEEKLKKVRELKPLETTQERIIRREAEIKKQIEKGELKEIVQPGQYKTLVTGERVYVPGTVQLLKVRPELRVPKVKEKPLIEVEIYKPVKISPKVVEPTVKKITVPKVKVREKVKIDVISPTIVKEVLGVSVPQIVKPKVKIKEQIAPLVYTPTIIKERERVAILPFVGTRIITPTVIKTITPLGIKTVTPTVIEEVVPTVITQVSAKPFKPIIPIPLFKLPKEEKKDKVKKPRKVKEFERLYTNPIASPFAVPSTGKINKKNK